MRTQTQVSVCKMLGPVPGVVFLSWLGRPARHVGVWTTRRRAARGHVPFTPIQDPSGASAGVLIGSGGHIPKLEGDRGA